MTQLRCLSFASRGRDPEDNSRGVPLMERSVWRLVTSARFPMAEKSS